MTAHSPCPRSSGPPRGPRPRPSDRLADRLADRGADLSADRGIASLGRLVLLVRLLVLSLLGCGLTACGDAEPAPARRKPTSEQLNVIVISIDTLRWDHVGFHGYERNTTPTLDELASRSLVFERAYTSFSWTLVAHMSMLTGLHPSQHGVYSENATLPEAVPTLAQRLRDEGWYTMGFHDSKWLEPRYGYDRGFDVYERHRGAQQAGAHVQYALEKRPKDKPFFLFLHLMDVHNKELDKPGCTVYEPPEPFDTLFLPEASERLAGLDAEAAWKGDLTDLTPEQHEALVALYDGGIRYVDTKLGEWLETWWRTGLLDRTLLIVTSDHGESLAQRNPAYGGHGYAYEEGLRVPLLVHLPRDARGGERISSPVAHVDLLPTVLEALGLPADERLPGSSLLGDRPADVLITSEQPDRIEAFLQWPWKLVRSTRGPGLRLYDLRADPGELQPVEEGGPRWSEAEPIARAFGQRVAAERQRAFRPAAESTADPLSAEERAQLQALGYLGSDEDP